jgi:hypothetical protein
MELTVRTGNAEALDATIQQLPMCGAQVIEGSWSAEDRACRVRVAGDVGFFRFALERQGYGEIVDAESS